MVGQITEAIKQEIGDVPLFIKIAYLRRAGANEVDLRLLHELLEKTVERGLVQGVSAINTIPARLVNAQGLQALPNNSAGGGNREFSGVCGAAIKWAGLSMTRHLAAARAELVEKGGDGFIITGVGGVTTPQDYFDYIAAGADEVMAATGPMWNANLANQIKQAVDGADGADGADSAQGTQASGTRGGSAQGGTQASGAESGGN
jgi:dihydroorotate dehydrogenase